MAGKHPGNWLDRRFVLVAGKGGVGKSTVAAVLGLLASRAGKRTVVAELGAREKVALLFGRGPSGYEPREVAPGLFTMNIDPEPALHEYGVRKLRFERVYKAVFENETMHRLLEMVPGMHELLYLGKAFDLEREMRGGRPTWDMVIVDAPATGHGLSLLRLPETILDVVSTGPMAEEVGLMQALLHDEARTMLNVVTLPEEMPVRETLELLAAVEGELAIPTGWLFVNGVWPDTIRDGDLEALRALGHGDPDVAGALAAAEAMANRRRFQEGYLEELDREVGIPKVHLPYLFTRDFGPEAIATLAGHATRGMEAPS